MFFVFWCLNNTLHKLSGGWLVLHMISSNTLTQYMTAYVCGLPNTFMTNWLSTASFAIWRNCAVDNVTAWHQLYLYTMLTQTSLDIEGTFHMLEGNPTTCLSQWRVWKYMNCTTAGSTWRYIRSTTLSSYTNCCKVLQTANQWIASS